LSWLSYPSLTYLAAITVGVAATLLSRAVLTLPGLIALAAFLSLLTRILAATAGLLTGSGLILIALATLLSLIASVLCLLIATFLVLAHLAALVDTILIVTIRWHTKVSSIGAVNVVTAWRSTPAPNAGPIKRPRTAIVALRE
jgi:hypothetical protein